MYATAERLGKTQATPYHAMLSQAGPNYTAPNSATSSRDRLLPNVDKAMSGWKRFRRCLSLPFWMRNDVGMTMHRCSAAIRLGFVENFNDHGLIAWLLGVERRKNLCPSMLSSWARTAFRPLTIFYDVEDGAALFVMSFVLHNVPPCDNVRAIPDNGIISRGGYAVKGNQAE